MTKADLVKLLEPFPDETVIRVDAIAGTTEGAFMGDAFDTYTDGARFYIRGRNCGQTE